MNCSPVISKHDIPHLRWCKPTSSPSHDIPILFALVFKQNVPPCYSSNKRLSSFKILWTMNFLLLNYIVQISFLLACFEFVNALLFLKEHSTKIFK